MHVICVMCIEFSKLFTVINVRYTYSVFQYVNVCFGLVIFTCKMDAAALIMYLSNALMCVLSNH